MTEESDLQLTNLERVLLAIRNDIVWFAEEIIGLDLFDWQKKVLQAFVKEDQLAIRSGHGVGKTTTMAIICHWTLLAKEEAFVLITAPSEDTIRNNLWKELSLLHQKMPQEIKEKIVVSDLSAYRKDNPAALQVKARTTKSETPEAGAGTHSKNMYVIIDEASGVSEAVFETLIGAMTTPGAKTVMVGNPTRAQGRFYNAFHSAREYWWTLRVSCLDLPERQIRKKFIDSLKAEFGVDSNIYRVRVLGEFPLGDDDTLIPMSWLEAAVNREVAVIESAPVYWGLDVAHFGADRSALAKRKGNHLLEKIQTWQGKDTQQLAGLVIDQYNETPFIERPAEIMVDVIGIGTGVADALIHAGLPVCRVNVSESPSVKDKYAKLRDELWYRAREWFELRDCKIPEDNRLISELAAPSYKMMQANGQIKVESKDEMKKRLKISPDVADAFCLTLMRTNKNPNFIKPIKYETDWIH